MEGSWVTGNATNSSLKLGLSLPTLWGGIKGGVWSAPDLSPHPPLREAERGRTTETQRTLRLHRESTTLIEDRFLISVTAFPSLTSCDQIMAGRRIKPSDIGGMAIDASEVSVLIDGRQLIAYVQAQSLPVVALGARGDWHIRFETAQGARLGDVDMAGSAFGDVVFLLASTFMTKLHRYTFYLINFDRLRRQLMTARTVFVYRFFRFPVAVKTGGMINRDGLKRKLVRHESVPPARGRRRGQTCSRCVANGAVVVSLFLEGGMCV